MKQGLRPGGYLAHCQRFMVIRVTDATRNGSLVFSVSQGPQPISMHDSMPGHQGHSGPGTQGEHCKGSKGLQGAGAGKRNVLPTAPDFVKIGQCSVHRRCGIACLLEGRNYALLQRFHGGLQHDC